MNIRHAVAAAAVGCALGFTGIGVQAGVANADPPQCGPQAWQCGPGGGPHGPGGPPPNDFRGRGPGGQGGPGAPGGPPNQEFRDFRDGGPQGHDWRPPWNQNDNDWRGRFQGAPWGDGPAPWGWGAPPPPPWVGPLPPAWGPPPPPVNYWGFQEQPIWDQGYNQWGFWFFGIWIPLPF